MISQQLYRCICDGCTHGICVVAVIGTAAAQQIPDVPNGKYDDHRRRCDVVLGSCSDSLTFATSPTLRSHDILTFECRICCQWTGADANGCGCPAWYVISYIARYYRQQFCMQLSKPVVVCLLFRYAHLHAA
jgi:hypothetical protein